MIVIGRAKFFIFYIFPVTNSLKEARGKAFFSRKFPPHLYINLPNYPQQQKSTSIIAMMIHQTLLSPKRLHKQLFIKISSEILMMSERLCPSATILCRRIYLCDYFFTKSIFKFYRQTESVRLKTSLHNAHKSYLLCMSNYLCSITVNCKADISVKIMNVGLYRGNRILGLCLL